MFERLRKWFGDVRRVAKTADCKSVTHAVNIEGSTPSVPTGNKWLQGAGNPHNVWEVLPDGQHQFLFTAKYEVQAERAVDAHNRDTGNADSDNVVSYHAD